MTNPRSTVPLIGASTGGGGGGASTAPISQAAPMGRATPR